MAVPTVKFGDDVAWFPSTKMTENPCNARVHRAYQNGSVDLDVFTENRLRRVKTVAHHTSTTIKYMNADDQVRLGVWASLEEFHAKQQADEARRKQQMEQQQEAERAARLLDAEAKKRADAEWEAEQRMLEKGQAPAPAEAPWNKIREQMAAAQANVQQTPTQPIAVEPVPFDEGEKPKGKAKEKQSA